MDVASGSKSAHLFRKNGFYAITQAIEGVSMSISRQASRAKILSRWFPEVSDATAETVEILMDVDQVGQLLNSLDELRRGQLVGLSDAFADL